MLSYVELEKSFITSGPVEKGIYLLLQFQMLHSLNLYFYLLSKDKRKGLEVIKLEFILRLKVKRNDWLLADTCPQAANHCALFLV